MVDQGNKVNRLRPITVRFTQDAYDAIRDVADDNSISKAELVRMALAGNLNEYLGDIRIIDKRQGAEIKGQITALFDVVSEIKNELHRIGVNYNQEIRLKNIKRKYGTVINDKRTEEEQAVLDDSVNLSKEELSEIISRYELATKRTGEVLCRILG